MDHARPLNQVKVGILDDPGINAASAGGGEFYVTTGLLRKATDEQLMAPWTLRRGAREFFTMPKASCWRTFVMNHLIHHRGQLSVYLRQLDVPLPSIYGPSADERPF